MDPARAVEIEIAREHGIVVPGDKQPGLSEKAQKDRPATRQKAAEAKFGEYQKRVDPLYKELERLTHEYNVNAAKGGMELRNEADLASRRQETEKQVMKNLTEAYTTKEGLTKAIKQKRQMIDELRKQGGNT